MRPILGLSPRAISPVQNLPTSALRTDKRPLENVVYLLSCLDEKWTKCPEHHSLIRRKQ